MNTAVERVALVETERVVVSAETGTVVVAGVLGPPGENKISESGDVDLTELTDGATLVYTTSTSKWTATNKLDRQIVECGQF